MTDEQQVPDPSNGKPAERSRFADIKGLLTREQVFENTALLFEVVEVPEWKKEGASKVIVQELTAEQRDIWEMQTITRRGDNTMEVNLANARAKLCQLSILDPTDGLLLFSPDDVERLGRLSGAAMQRVFEMATKLSKLGKEDIEALVKDLGPTSEEGSSSSSPSDSDTPAASSLPS